MGITDNRCFGGNTLIDSSTSPSSRKASYSATTPEPYLIELDLVSALAQSTARRNPFDRLPDEIVEHIISLVGLSKNPSADPFRLGWNDEIEMLNEARESELALRPLRLVSCRFLLVSAPVYFRRLFIRKSNRSDGQSSGQVLVRLTELLSSKPIVSHPASKPYGHHVRKLIFVNRDESPAFVLRLLDAIQTLIPNLSELSSLNLSKLPILLSPGISFPLLDALTEIDAAPSLDEWNVVRYVPSSTPLLRSASSSGFLSQEILFGFLNHHPCIKKLSCRGIHLDSFAADRLVHLLRSSRLSVALLPCFQRPARFSGLTKLHIGHHSLIDLEFFKLIPSVAPQLEQLHIDAGCQLENRSLRDDDDWTLLDLLRSLPHLTQLTFIAQQALPIRNRSTRWAALDQVLKASPRLQSLNLRTDLLDKSTLFELLGSTALRRLNIWHKPVLHVATESWAIVCFESIPTIKKLGHLGRSLFQAGLEWPKAEDSRRDLWLKLKSLSQFVVEEV